LLVSLHYNGRIPRVAVEASEFVMKLLIPEDELVAEIKAMADKFKVTEEVMVMRIGMLIE